MVPPITTESDALVRIGHQRTYVFHKNGIETIGLQPGFSGKVDEFGMLIPFPSPPAVRKLPENFFAHIAAAIDPPEVVVNVSPQFGGFGGGGAFGGVGGGGFLGAAPDPFGPDQVRVVREEAVGMYELAVLQAGSAKALARWMKEHAYRFPDGMEDVCNEYVSKGWCFVAVKSKVGREATSQPKPAQREVKNKLPEDWSFDGEVQAMEFRFPSEELIVPMRLSVFNEGELRNIVYVLSDSPNRIRDIPEEYVVRQIPGGKLIQNLTGPLPLRVVGGTAKDIQKWQRENLISQRDPRPANGKAAELFAADVDAAISGELISQREANAKQMLNISERLQLRGEQIDRSIERSDLREHHAKVRKSLDELRDMTLSVIDGDYPRDVLADDNLTFSEYTVSSAKNTSRNYNAREAGPTAKPEGILYLGALPPLPEEDVSHIADMNSPRKPAISRYNPLIWFSVAIVLFGLLCWRRTSTIDATHGDV